MRVIHGMMNGECMVESKIVNLVLQRDYEICT